MFDTVREYAGRLTVVRCWCGIQHAIPESLHNEQIRKKDIGGELSVYCPVGHTYIAAGETEADKLRKQLTAKQARLERIQADRDRQKNKLTATKGVVTRLKKRVGNGVCPCCNRHFANLYRHMNGQHPGFVEEKDDG